MEIMEDADPWGGRWFYEGLLERLCGDGRLPRLMACVAALAVLASLVCWLLFFPPARRLQDDSGDEENVTTNRGGPSIVSAPRSRESGEGDRLQWTPSLEDISGEQESDVSQSPVSVSAPPKMGLMERTPGGLSLSDPPQDGLNFTDSLSSSPAFPVQVESSEDNLPQQTGDSKDIVDGNMSHQMKASETEANVPVVGETLFEDGKGIQRGPCVDARGREPMSCEVGDSSEVGVPTLVPTLSWGIQLALVKQVLPLLRKWIHAQRRLKEPSDMVSVVEQGDDISQLEGKEIVMIVTEGPSHSKSCISVQVSDYCRGIFAFLGNALQLAGEDCKSFLNDEKEQAKQRVPQHKIEEVFGEVLSALSSQHSPCQARKESSVLLRSLKVGDTKGDRKEALITGIVKTMKEGGVDTAAKAALVAQFDSTRIKLENPRLVAKQMFSRLLDVCIQQSPGHKSVGAGHKSVGASAAEEFTYLGNKAALKHYSAGKANSMGLQYAENLVKMVGVLLEVICELYYAKTEQEDFLIRMRLCLDCMAFVIALLKHMIDVSSECSRLCFAGSFLQGTEEKFSAKVGDCFFQLCRASADELLKDIALDNEVLFLALYKHCFEFSRSNPQFLASPSGASAFVATIAPIVETQVFYV